MHSEYFWNVVNECFTPSLHDRDRKGAEKLTHTHTCVHTNIHKTELKEMSSHEITAICDISRTMATIRQM